MARRDIARSYFYTHTKAILTPTVQIVMQPGILNLGRAAQLSREIRDGDDLPPVVVFREPKTAVATLLDGSFWRICLALGYPSMSTWQPTRADAELTYRY